MPERSPQHAPAPASPRRADIRPAVQAAGPLAARILPLQRSLGNSAVQRMILQRALTCTFDAKTRKWSLTGRPDFPSALTEGMPVDAGYHRAHSAAWENIREGIVRVLNGDLEGSEAESFFVNLLEPLAELDESAFDLEQGFKELLLIRDGKWPGDATARVRQLATGFNAVFQNLDEGEGRTNSTIQGHYDPKVVFTANGWDIREADREALPAMAHLLRPPLVDLQRGELLASTAPNGRVPVNATTGILAEICHPTTGWFVPYIPRKKGSRSKAPAATTY